MRNSNCKAYEIKMLQKVMKINVIRNPHSGFKNLFDGCILPWTIQDMYIFSRPVYSVHSYVAVFQDHFFPIQFELLTFQLFCFFFLFCVASVSPVKLMNASS